MTDLDELSGAGADARVADEGQALPEGGQPRDEGGRFAGGQQQPNEGEGQPQPEGGEQGSERNGWVPHSALHAVREEAKGYREKYTTLEARFNDQQQQIQQLIGLMRQPSQPQKQEAPPDWFQDPDAAFQHNVRQAVDPLQTQLQAQREGFSQMLAVEKYGAEAVQAAQAELEQRVRSNPNGTRFDYQRIMADPHPYGALVQWHKQQATLQRVGSDPDAFIEAEVSRRLAAMGHQPQPQQAAPQQQPAHAPQAMPSNFATARSAGPRGGTAASSGPKPLSEIFGGR
ncbi:hypothetical protein J2X36_002142 [Methylobacterium sp. BE186]|uniref:hypothetical protein n=1 Tax=Methylobacterium sp. BE186 TaxID=2817715 RepID=UPI00285CE52B|nr:hypothetical protein [Methylobacterium sp. BE186]MDR7037395.1 hypothetical protein [Methylobacterium sp. BE186]